MTKTSPRADTSCPRAGDTPRRHFRLVCDPDQAGLVEDLLRAQGFAFQAAPFWPLARRLLSGPKPLGESLAARLGFIYIQDASSMLPPLALDPEPGSVVLDACAAPGSKTSLLAQLTGARGLVAAVEPNRGRLENMRANMNRLNLLQVVTLPGKAEAFPAPEGCFPGLLLDPPCSGWGTTDKNPGAVELWQGKRIRPMLQLQRRMLARAAALLAPGGAMVYSTCTTNPDENAGQLVPAMEQFGLRLDPLDPFPGFDHEDPGLPGALQIATRPGLHQGFFLARLVKEDGPTPEPYATCQDRDQLPGRLLDPRQIRTQGLTPDWDRLPPGRAGLFGQKLYFVPRAALTTLPPGLRFHGLFLGRARETAEGVEFQPRPKLRLMLPEHDPERDIRVHDVEELRALLSGREFKRAGREGAYLGLRYKDLPVGFLRIKSGRLIFGA